ncbi:hypothetical protein Nepgr_001002 [Nepenthes gracilis]|uniref:Uncharacterized protein n=1 Tax=Nepenthes gracilis TaxID=150966 RepID=A0AAD3RXA0_NEPGR|nr:hypothetical protein Nepgr_001002 [Nepenthes gracilis]
MTRILRTWRAALDEEFQRDFPSQKCGRLSSTAEHGIASSLFSTILANLMAREVAGRPPENLVQNQTQTVD